MRGATVVVGAMGFVGCMSACAADDTVAGGFDAAPDSTVAPSDAGHDASAANDASDATIDASDARADGSIDATLDAPDATPTGVGCDPASYPSGPFGTAPGDVIADLAFTGLTDANQNGTVADDPPITICLGRYRNGQAAKLLVIHWTAAWCAPCQSEEPSWVALATQNAGKAVFFEAIAQNVAGLPATNTTMDGWAKTFGVGNDLGIDPSLLLGPYFAVSDGGVAWPAHLLVRTETMTIVSARVGADADAGDVQGEIDDALGSDAGGTD